MAGDAGEEEAEIAEEDRTWPFFGCLRRELLKDHHAQFSAAISRAEYWVYIPQTGRTPISLPELASSAPSAFSSTLLAIRLFASGTSAPVRQYVVIQTWLFAVRRSLMKL
jgi:hypothetical protein